MGEHEDKDERAKSGRGKHSRDEGEGNRTADRKYREGVRRHVESGASKPAADETQQRSKATRATSCAGPRTKQSPVVSADAEGLATASR
jgi:hypothetical protein